MRQPPITKTAEYLNSVAARRLKRQITMAISEAVLLSRYNEDLSRVLEALHAASTPMERVVQSADDDLEALVRASVTAVKGAT